MADLKISQLTGATTPLAGTEVLPIVQSGSTVKVANNDLRPKQIQSNATSGVLQIVGPAAAATRVMTTPDANFTAARTDAAQTFTGAQTFSSVISVGGATPSISGAGVTFPATQSVSSDANTLDDYEKGTWTPAIDSATAGTGRATTVYSSRYTKIGNTVYVSCYIAMNLPGTGGSGNLVINGLPFTAAANDNYAAVTVGYADNLNSNLVFIGGYVNMNTTQIVLTGQAAAGASFAPIDFATYIKGGTAFVISGFYTI